MREIWVDSDKMDMIEAMARDANASISLTYRSKGDASGLVIMAKVSEVYRLD